MTPYAPSSIPTWICTYASPLHFPPILSLLPTIYSIITPHSDELGLLPLPPTPDELPAATRQYHPFLLVGTKLGVPLDYVPVVLKGANAVFMRLPHARLEEAGETVVMALEEATRVIIVLNPECNTATNTRKKLVLANYLPAPTELRLLTLLLTSPRNTKSSTAWHHRRWLLQLSPHGPTTPLANEIALCHRTANLYPKNYYAWNHRHWVVSVLTEHARRSETVDSPCDGGAAAARALLQSEYGAMREWVRGNVGDHSGVQHLERCLVAVVGVDGEEKEKVREHVEWVREFVAAYPGHETLWCHLRFCAGLARELGAGVVGLAEEETFVRRCVEEAETGKGAMTETDPVVLARQRMLAWAYQLWVVRLVRDYGFCGWLSPLGASPPRT
ncbi:hypothetical protein BC936DRAFT_139857 [Jimgerdemannia flammicorona]|uniref:Protein prenylyltransferase n=1 Tax=Jimgerdemannia flammicorona TaxID=994334 RepID=A0A433DHC6_9FUNG|nr:hypothetical protein BC936DRAFT_139857 [Jimgerdemannia flammicorona]